MYIAMTILLLLALFGIIFFHFRKKQIIEKVCSMTPFQRTQLLNQLAEPFGYLYDPNQEIFSNTEAAWQKEFGYGAIYDRFAPYFGMVFHYLPVYFDYNGRTWLMEFWKGQYGINIGCETGIYYADGIVPKALRPVTLFQAAAFEDLPPVAEELFYHHKSIGKLQKIQWWVTIFSMGLFAKPEQLSSHISIDFPTQEMRDAFLEGLLDAGYTKEDFCICCTTVSLSLKDQYLGYSILKRLYCRYVLVKNHFFCKLYHLVTRPFSGDREKLLYLYYYLPFGFRRMFRLKRFKKHRKHHK